MAFVDAAKYNEVRKMRGLPIGAIVPWAAESSAIPTGWVICNGRAEDIEKYPLLYEVIGNTYGGTAGSTFRVPKLTNSQKAIVDIFQGHFNWLQSKGDAHAPEYSNKSDDEFWTIVGGGTNGDEGSNNQQTWISTIDLVGEIASPPNFLASYDAITISEGSYFAVATYEGTHLYDYHMNMHSHGIANTSSTESTAYQHGSGQAVHCPGGGWPVGSCKMVCNQTPCLRPRNGLKYANNSGHLNSEFAYWSSPAAGGGSVLPVPGGETASGGYYPGDGRCSGSMTCASFGGNDKILFTSLSNDETSPTNEHAHGTNSYIFESTFGVTSPGIVDNIGINNVAIVNSSGLNFGSITATTATPSLDAVFIIRAY